MTDAMLVGGTDADRQAVLAQHAAYLKANAIFDVDSLQNIWSGAEAASFFNMNGHTYVDRDHWIRLWNYYRQHMKTGEWIPFDMHGYISGDLAAIWCHRKTSVTWTGTDPRPDQNRHRDKEFISRSTMVFNREGGEWRVVHTHFSEASTDPRPGGI